MRLLCLLVGAVSGARGVVMPPRSKVPSMQATALVSTQDFSSPANGLLALYKKHSEESYLTVACIQSGVLRASSDALSQVLRGVEFDPAHALAMGTVGIVFSGLVGASWLSHLERQMGSGTTTKDVVKKSAADFLCYAPCANSAYLFFVPLLTLLYSPAHTVDVATATLAMQNGLMSAMALELGIFAPYNFVSFRHIPATYRPQTTAAACGAYTVVLSGLC